MKKVIFLLISIICVSEIYSEEYPKVGLVLSGGGAKGAAHIGVLKVLEENNIPIDYIVGTSIGGIIGGLYAIGYKASEIDSLMRNQDWLTLLTGQVNHNYLTYANKENKESYQLSLSFSKNKRIRKMSGFMSGESILNKFSDLTIGYHDVSTFDSLPIPYACISADLVQGCEIVMNNGSLPLAMRATMAVPGIFQPVRLDSMILVDGGIFNNLPVDVARCMGAEIIIGVDLNTSSERKEYELSDMLSRIAMLSGAEKYKQNKEQADILIRPELKGFSSASFFPNDIDTMITRGEKAAKESLNEILQIRYKTGNCKYIPKYTQKKEIVVGKININGLMSYKESWMKKKVNIYNGMNVSAKDIENIIYEIKGTGLFESVTYNIQSTGNNHTLNINVKEKPESVLNIGANLNSENIGNGVLQVKRRMGKKNRSMLSATMCLSISPWGMLDYSLYTDRMTNIGLSYKAGYSNFDLYHKGNKVDNIYFMNQHCELYFSDSFHKKFSYRIGCAWDFYNKQSALYTSDYNKCIVDKEFFGSIFYKLEYDNSDSHYFPTHGKRFFNSGHLYVSHNNSLFGCININYSQVIPLTDSFCVLPEIWGRFLIGNDIAPYFLNYIGGEYNRHNLSWRQVFYGITDTELIGDKSIGCTLNIRYNIKGNHYISCIGNCAISNGKVQKHIDKIYWGSALKYSYDSVLGPLDFSLCYSNNSQKVGINFNIGYCF